MALRSRGLVFWPGWLACGAALPATRRSLQVPRVSIAARPRAWSHERAVRRFMQLKRLSSRAWHSQRGRKAARAPGSGRSRWLCFAFWRISWLASTCTPAAA